MDIKLRHKKAEDQVPTLETCQKLKELKIKFDSYFIWQKYIDNWYIADYTADVNYLSSCGAPTAQELLDKMPITIEPKLDHYKRLEISKYKEMGDGPVGNYCRYGDSMEFRHKNLAEALAQMRLWLHENKYLDKK